MNAVEIEAAISDLAEAPFDAAEFPFQFLECFGHKKLTIDRLRSGNNNSSDVQGGVLLNKQIHMAVAPKGCVGELLAAVRISSANTKGKPQFLLATDGDQLEAEDLESGDTIACDYADFPNHFGFLLPLGGISTVREIKENPIDVRATSRLNKLYVELLRENPEWGTSERQNDMNHFMARLVFCFFAEDTAIFGGDGLFTKTVDQMSDRDGSNTHAVIETIFKAMNISHKIRPVLDPRLPTWADTFPYVNGGLFAGNTDVPKFSRTARRFLVHAGDLNWQQINPDIFGSMIQAVANAEERSNLGMHYTSVPNILKVLNPLFLDDLKGHLKNCGDNALKLLNLRKRLAKIRVFDPACGSGNFLVIAYKQLREIEAEINRRRNESHLPTTIPLTNFRGIELNSFPAEIARLSLIITEFQCDVLYRGQQDAITEFLPLNKENWIICENALHVDWQRLVPIEGTEVDVAVLGTDDMFEAKQENIEYAFDNEGGEGYICGNPPYLGSTWQSDEHKKDLAGVFGGRIKSYKSLDYVSGWFMKAADYCARYNAAAAFVSTNSICQGQQVPILWPTIFKTGCEINFAYESFKWSNLAAHKAGVTVVIVGIAARRSGNPRLFTVDKEDQVIEKSCDYINAYLINARNVIVVKASIPLTNSPEMLRGNMPYDGGNLLMSATDANALGLTNPQRSLFLRRIYGSAEFIRSIERYCLWIADEHLKEAMSIETIAERVEGVRTMRLASKDAGANAMALRSHQMREMNIGSAQTIVVPCVSSETREYLPAGVVDSRSTVTNLAFALYDAPLWTMSLIASRLHLAWVATVCGKLETRYRYSNTMGWNTFPVPTLTEQNKADLTRCAEDILLAREAHFPKTIADLYDSEAMPENLRIAHERNDEMLERIYIGRRFKNDTERLEKLFDMYTKLATTSKTKPIKRATRA